MNNDLTELTIDEIKNGYQFNADHNKYICNHCGKEFFVGEIYQFEERFFDSQRGVAIHIDKEHGKQFDTIIKSESKYLALTQNQKGLLKMFKSGLSDNDIAKELGVSPSTVRQQKFMFREKAKQAKLYLAVYELALVEDTTSEKLIPIHEYATMVDDRYITTEEEKKKTIKTAFKSLNPLKLTAFPAKEKKKIVVLQKITELFEPSKHYKEKELNQILKDIYEDFATIRRYLIEYGFMDRTMDCKEYWLK